MFRTIDEHVFPFIRAFNGEGTSYARHMRDARFQIPGPALLAKVVDKLDKLDMGDRDTKGDVYEYMLLKIASAGQNGQFRTPRLEVMTSTRVMSCDVHGVELEHGRLDASTIIWAAGVVASPAARWLDAEHDRAGRVKVGADLSVPSHPEIFVVGDTAAVTDQPSIPGTAPAAKQMGRYVGRLIAARVAGMPSLPPFLYRHAGDLATVGRHAAVVKLGQLELTGFLGWLFWSVVHIYFLIEVRDRFIVAFTWLWDYVTFQRGARLITEVPPAQRN